MRQPTESRVLNSWKEVAAYVGRGVRTVQRWERELGFPVRRPRANSHHSPVLALTSDIDAWLGSRQVSHLTSSRNDQTPPAPKPRSAATQDWHREGTRLLLELARLQSKAESLRKNIERAGDLSKRLASRSTFKPAPRSRSATADR